MVGRILRLQRVVISLCFFCCQASADTFLIVDQDGKPVSQAVIEFTASQGGPLWSHTKQTAVMDQVNKRFVPGLLTITRGDEVNFPNSDNIRHHVYSFSQPKPFELKLYSGQPEAPLLFDKPGIVVLGCNIHDSMVGYIYVAESEQVVMTNNKGLASIGSNLKYDGLRVWHPEQRGGHLGVKTLRRDQLKPMNEDHQLFIIDLLLEPPEPRNTFQSVFKHDH